MPRCLRAGDLRLRSRSRYSLRAQAQALGADAPHFLLWQRGLWVIQDELQVSGLKKYLSSLAAGNTVLGVGALELPLAGWGRWGLIYARTLRRMKRFGHEVRSMPLALGL